MKPTATRSWSARPFRAAAWARGPNTQTLTARLLRSTHGPPLRRERIDTPDGDFLDLDWAPEPAPDAPLVLVLHGLEGGAHRSYVRSLCRLLLARGVRPVALNFRGCSGEPNRLPRFYHSGETSDVLLVLRLLAERFPHRRLGAFGFSLGGNVLLKLLGEGNDGGRDVVDAAAVMSVPFDLAAGARTLESSPWGSFYTWYFLRSLRRKVRAKASILAGHIDVERALAATTLRHFDDAATAPLHGFRDAAAYYEACSSRRFLAGVRVPTAVFHSLDDPFLPAEHVPVRELEGNAWLHAFLPSRGGHVGFLEGTPVRPRFWADEEAARFLADALTDGVPRRAAPGSARDCADG